MTTLSIHQVGIVWDDLQCCLCAVSVIGNAEEGVARQRKQGGLRRQNCAATDG